MHHRVSGVPASPIRALDKKLRDGRRLALDLVPRAEDGGYWMRVEIDGVAVDSSFTSSIQRDASPLPDLPHVIKVPTARYKPFQPLGLTAAEADGIDHAKAEWDDRHYRALLSADPAAPTIERTTTQPVRPGFVVDLGDDRYVVVAVAERFVEEDGRSFHLDSEQGWLYDLRVRALTDAERQRANRIPR